MCPVKMLDEQSGELRTNAGTVTSDMASMGYHGGLGSARQVVADAGGASRFFPSFHGQEPPAAPFMYTSKASRKETTLDGVVENNHPTKKPLALMEWLVKLVCPKGGVVLDPYCGSGTTCVAATLHDMHFTGIEKDEKYHAIACKRVGIVYEQQEYERAAKSVFDFMEQIDAELGDDEDMYGGLRR
jgi:site-specific DNA-methyltransferase (adenine-specific)